MPRLPNLLKQASLPDISKGTVNYDNVRENIDPHVKTKVVSTLEISSGAKVLGDLDVLGILSGGHITATETDPIWNSQSGAIKADIAGISGSVITNTANITNNNDELKVVSGARALNKDDIAGISGALTQLSGAHEITVSELDTLSGAVSLAPSNITQLSGAVGYNTDTTQSGSRYIANVIHNTASGGFVASDYPIGTLFVVYTA